MIRRTKTIIYQYLNIDFLLWVGNGIVGLSIRLSINLDLLILLLIWLFLFY
jgi:hypothetical protein